jgi:hypothetical protein
MARTSNWKTAYLEKDGLTHFIVNKVKDKSVNAYTDEIITQAMKDTVINIRTNQLDPVLNDFYKNGNTVFVDDDSAIPPRGRTLFYWFTNDNPAGYFGKGEENGVVVRATMSVNKDYWNDGTASVILGLLQEQLSVKGFYELLNSEKGSIFDAYGSSLTINNYDKMSLEWYQVRTQQLAKEGAETKGFWGWDIDQRVFEEAANNPYVQSFINQYAMKEAQDQLNKFKSGSMKSATIDDRTYTLKTFMPDGSINTKTFTKDNFQSALEDMSIPNSYKQEIEQTFEK